LYRFRLWLICPLIRERSSGQRWTSWVSSSHLLVTVYWYQLLHLDGFTLLHWTSTNHVFGRYVLFNIIHPDSEDYFTVTKCLYYWLSIFNMPHIINNYKKITTIKTCELSDLLFSVIDITLFNVVTSQQVVDWLSFILGSVVCGQVLQTQHYLQTDSLSQNDGIMQWQWKSFQIHQLQ